MMLVQLAVTLDIKKLLTSRSCGTAPLRCAAPQLERYVSISSMNRKIPNEMKSELYKNIKSGNIEVVKEIVLSGANVHEYEDSYFSLVESATRENQTEIVLFLLESGAGEDKRAITKALFWAITGVHEEIVKLLLKYGANPNHFWGQGSYLTHACIHLTKDYKCLPLSPERLRVVELLLEYGADCNHKKDNKIGPPIYKPIVIGDINTVNLLLKHSAKLTSMKILVAVNVCALQGRFEMLELLLEHNFKPNPKKSKDNLPASPLHYAIKNGHVDIVKLLIKNKINLEYVPNYSPNEIELNQHYEYHPLALTTIEKQYEIMEILLNLGVDPDSKAVVRRTEFPPLIYAVTNNDITAVKILI